MRSPQVFQAKLIRFALDVVSKPIIIQSTGDALALSVNNRNRSIFSVVDSDGVIVRTVHNWLCRLGQQAGLTYSIGTIEQYGRTLSYLCRWIETNRPYPSLDVDGNIKLLCRQDIVTWLSDMRDGGCRSKKTLHSREACLKEFLDWLTTKEGRKLRDAENSPWGRDGSLRYVTATPSARSPKFIPADMVVEVLNGMHNECERCMFHSQYDMGLRISELVNLKAREIPSDEMYDPAYEFIPICVNGVKGRGGQTNERITLISRAVLKRIKRYHSSREYKLASDWDINDPNKPAFLTVNQRKWSVRNASKQFKKSVRRCELIDQLKTHWLRHGTAFSVLRSNIGKDYQDRMLMLQQMLGHSDLKTTEIYTQISPALLTSLTKAGREINRLDEAELIREQTYLGPLQHKERRGHRE